MDDPIVAFVHTQSSLCWPLAFSLKVLLHCTVHNKITLFYNFYYHYHE